MYCEAGGEAGLGSIGGHSGYGTVVFSVMCNMVVVLGAGCHCVPYSDVVVVIYQDGLGHGECWGRRLTMPFLVSSRQCIPSLPSWSTLLS